MSDLLVDLQQFAESWLATVEGQRLFWALIARVNAANPPERQAFALQQLCAQEARRLRSGR